MKTKKIRAKAICIKTYSDEDDLDRYRKGEIEWDEIKIYNVGEEGEVVVDFYSDKYWKLK